MRRIQYSFLVISCDITSQGLFFISLPPIFVADCESCPSPQAFPEKAAFAFPIQMLRWPGAAEAMAGRNHLLIGNLWRRPHGSKRQIAGLAGRGASCHCPGSVRCSERRLVAGFARPCRRNGWKVTIVYDQRKLYAGRRPALRGQCGECAPQLPTPVNAFAPLRRLC